MAASSVNFKIYKKHGFNVLRIANQVEELIQNFDNLRAAMGAMFSSFKRKKQQRRANKK